jgi:hypothetical protein
VTWGGRCPYCGEVFRGLKDGKTMGQHKTPWNIIASSRRESCPYGGATREDTERRITPLMRRTQAYIVRAVQSGKPMTGEQRELLAARGLLDETLALLAEADAS